MYLGAIAMKGYFAICQSSIITEASPSEHLFGKSYPSAEMLSVYSTLPLPTGPDILVTWLPSETKRDKNLSISVNFSFTTDFNLPSFSLL